MNENVDDLEKALKVIAVLPEKTNTEEPSGGEEKSAAEEALQDEASSVRPAVSPLPSLLGESSDKLSRMLKNVLQAKVRRHLLLIRLGLLRHPVHYYHHTRTTLTSLKATERRRRDLYFSSNRECL